MKKQTLTASIEPARRKHRRNMELTYLIMCMPGLVWLLFFHLIPITGIWIAFVDYAPKRGIFGSTFVGMKNFQYLFKLRDTRKVITNTFLISICKLFLNLFIPLVFAILLNEVTNLKFKKAVQTIVYLPHFISWVILANILTKIFGYSGIINYLITLFGREKEVLLQDPQFFRQLIIFSDIWKEYGFNAIIYLSAITQIDPNLYESIAIDGGGKWKSVLYITLPELEQTIVLLGTLSLGNILNAGFDQIFNMYNPMVYSTSDIIDTWVYRIGLVDMNYAVGTCAGLFKSVVSFVLVAISYLLAKKFADYKVF